MLTQVTLMFQVTQQNISRKIKNKSEFELCKENHEKINHSPSLLLHTGLKRMRRPILPFCKKAESALQTPLFVHLWWLYANQNRAHQFTTLSHPQQPELNRSLSN